MAEEFSKNPEITTEGNAPSEKGGESPLEVGDAVRRIEKGVEAADRIDEALTRSKKGSAKRQKKEDKAKKKSDQGDDDDRDEDESAAKKGMAYFANGMGKVSTLVRKDIKLAALALKDLRSEYRLEKEKK